MLLLAPNTGICCLNGAYTQHWQLLLVWGTHKKYKLRWSDQQEAYLKPPFSE